MSTKFLVLREKYEIIKDIKVGDKLCVITWRNVTKSWYGSFVRYWTGENRVLTIEQLNTLIDKTKKYIRKMEIDELFPFQTLLKESILGIDNLIKTYKKDTKMVIDLNNVYIEMRKLIKLIEFRVEFLSMEKSENNQPKREHVQVSWEQVQSSQPLEDSQIYYSVELTRNHL